MSRNETNCSWLIEAFSKSRISLVSSSVCLQFRFLLRPSRHTKHRNRPSHDSDLRTWIFKSVEVNFPELNRIDELLSLSNFSASVLLASIDLTVWVGRKFLEKSRKPLSQNQLELGSAKGWNSICDGLSSSDFWENRSVETENWNVWDITSSKSDSITCD